ncbi:MAG TPA: hypothetical protein VGR57_20830 [Ktedonobacterales bacterium]|nr:hypothetical protein [Ktedonobacterales bacterium]
MGQIRGLVLVGIVLIVGGVIGLAYPIFTTSQTKDVAHIGDLKLQSTEETDHTIPPLAAGGALALGVVLVGAGLYRKN